jgi:hypothetical protein
LFFGIPIEVFTLEPPFDRILESLKGLLHAVPLRNISVIISKAARRIGSSEHATKKSRQQLYAVTMSEAVE